MVLCWNTAKLYHGKVSSQQTKSWAGIWSDFFLDCINFLLKDVLCQKVKPLFMAWLTSHTKQTAVIKSKSNTLYNMDIFCSKPFRQKVGVNLYNIQFKTFIGKLVLVKFWHLLKDYHIALLIYLTLFLKLYN